MRRIFLQLKSKRRADPPPQATSIIERKTSSYEEFVEMISAFGGPLDGKRVLEIGSGYPPDFLADIDSAYTLSEAVGINIEVQDQQFTPTMRNVRGDARDMNQFETNYFDLIISSSVFEHLHDFSIALLEMYRVLKPGGLLFSHFGPIWSGSYGHHLWLYTQDKLINYHNTELPPFCHLLMTENELSNYLSRTGNPYSKQICEYVFRSEDQNKLMYSDYDRFVAESDFERLYLKGYDYQLYRTVTAENLAALNTAFPHDADKFMYDGIQMLLRKPSI